MIALRIEFLSLHDSPVNITPTAVRSVYHPITSVSLMDIGRTDSVLSSAFPFFSELWWLPPSSSISRKGSLDRSVLLRSTAIIRLKVSSFKTSRAPVNDHSSRGLAVLVPLSERSRVTTNSSLGGYAASHDSVKSDGDELLLSPVLFL